MISSNVLLIRHVILPILLQPYKSAVHILRPIAPAKMATRRRRSLPSDGPAKRPVLRQIQGDEVELLPTIPDICTYWPSNPAFDP